MLIMHEVDESIERHRSTFLQTCKHQACAHRSYASGFWDGFMSVISPEPLRRHRITVIMSYPSSPTEDFQRAADCFKAAYDEVTRTYVHIGSQIYGEGVKCIEYDSPRVGSVDQPEDGDLVGIEYCRRQSEFAKQR